MRLTQIRNAEKNAIQQYDETLSHLNARIDAQTIPQGHEPSPQALLSSNPSQTGYSSDQTDELERIAEMTDEEQSNHFTRLTGQIGVATRELEQSRKTYQQETDEFREIYEKTQVLFETFGCSWEECPDGRSTVNIANVTWVLEVLEKQMAETMNAIFDEVTKQFDALGTPIRPAGSEGEPSGARLLLHPREQNVSFRHVEHSRPMTIEEIQQLL
jgi:hypothetical protein